MDSLLDQVKITKCRLLTSLPKAKFTAEGNIPNNSHYTHHTEVFFKLILLAAHYHNQHNLLFYSLNKGWLLLKWSGQKT